MKEAESLDELLSLGVENNASDVHLATGAPPRIRVFGQLRDLPYEILTDSSIKGLLNNILDAYARREIDSKGQWDLSYNIPNVARFRVNIFKQKGALSGVFRVLNSIVPSYKTLGLPVSIFNLTNKRRGLFLVTGATGSGKSTTLASFIDIINKNMYKHIITLEEPIEYLHWHNKSIVSQREIGKDVLDFDTGLRAALREDPDIIMVGEMRDSETINTALLAAETGHFVLSTLHTNGVAETIDRILETFPEKQHKQIRSILSSVIEGVVSQQLLPRKDGDGYVVACEVMYKTKELQRIIRYESTDKITEYISSEDGFNGNMCTMDSSICNLYFDNLISKDTALDYAIDRKYMQELIN